MPGTRTDISVIVPAYNVAPYIGQALESALAQDPPFRQIIVVDDGSTDATADVVARYACPAVHYHRQPHRGIWFARNTGIELAQSELVYFMDADDIVAKGLTAHVQRHRAATHEGCDAYFFSAVNVDDATGLPLGSGDYFRWRECGVHPSGRIALERALQSATFPVCVWLYVFARTLLDRGTPLRFRNMVHEDELFTPELLLRAGAVHMADDILYRRRIRSGSFMRSAATHGKADSLLCASRWWLDQTPQRRGDELALYLRRATWLYRRAVLVANHANLDLPTTLAMIMARVPQFEPVAERDCMRSRNPAHARRPFVDFRWTTQHARTATPDDPASTPTAK